MPRPRLNLEALLSPVSTADFFSRHWETEPLFVRRGDATLYASLLEPPELERLVPLATRDNTQAVETLGDPAGPAADVRQLKSADEAMEAYGRGATLRVNGVQSLSPPLGALSQSLEQEFGCPVNVNLYATPAGARGAVRHYDTHDVLVLQVAGRKTWRVYEPLVRLPLNHIPRLAFEEHSAEMKYARGGPSKGRGDIGDAESGEPTHEFSLDSGDLLYLPRGFVHEARTEEEHSRHLTVGLHVLTWLDLLTVALGQVSQRDERLRASLPAGLLHTPAASEALRERFAELLASFSRQARIADALGETLEGFVRSRTTSEAGDVGRSEAVKKRESEGAIMTDTLMERCRGVVCFVRVEGDSVGLVSAHGALWMPAMFRAALAFVARSCEFRVSEIPGGLSEGGRVALARRLAADGFVRVSKT